MRRASAGSDAHAPQDAVVLRGPLLLSLAGDGVDVAHDSGDGLAHDVVRLAVVVQRVDASHPALPHAAPQVPEERREVGLQSPTANINENNRNTQDKHGRTPTTTPRQ
jgi:hypothetical protein